MSFRKALITVACILSGILAGAQQYRVSGVVVDEDGHPLSFATVAVEQPPTGTYSADDGSFSLRLPKGKYTLAAAYVGYRSATKEITVQANVDTLTFILRSESLRIDEVVVTATQVDSKEGTSTYRIGD